MLENRSNDDTIRFERKSGTFLPYMEYEPHEQWFDDEDHVLVMTFVEVGGTNLEKRRKEEDAKEKREDKVSNL
jgi:hypothetical protein|tara:strand:+ start:110 stop:328 length:219 start_codon:yes stop_codon:yes gene_type:complete